MPRIKLIATRIGAAQSKSSLPYNVSAQKPATSRKLSHGSSELHDTRPSSLFKGKRYGWEYARARVTGGGVATSSGDFLWTIMVERRLEVLDVPERC